MKKPLSLFYFFLFTFYFASAQSPQGTSYQAIIRNSSGVLMSNRTVSLRFSIHDSAANGSIVYQETQTPVTTAQGLVNVNVGQGTAVSGTFAGINWGNKSKFLQVELDANGGTAYTDMGTQQLMSVPYAMYATKSQKSDTALYAANTMPNGNANGDILYWNGSSWVKLPLGNYGQSLVACDGVLTWGGCAPKVTTNTTSAISYTTATSGGNVIAEGGSSVTARGVCWSTSANPTIALTTKTIDGTGTGTFTSSITGLTANTVYYVRAYATNSVGTAYGAQQSFTTSALTLPTITTTATSSISYTSSTSGGNITNDGGAAISFRGVCWSTSSNPTVALSTKTVDGTGTGTFTSSITGLTANTTYYVRAYATNSVGTVYGAQQSFTTNAYALPIVTTNMISSITNTTATGGGNVTSDGGASVSFRGVCWSTATTPTVALSTKSVDGTDIGAFTSSITGLSPNTTYYVRAYATNSVGTAYGTQQSFTTTSGPVTIGTQIWSSQNLSVATYRNGDPIPQVTDATQWSNLTTGAWCWYNNDSATYAATYGRLYNWYAVNDPRGLAPQGWHVPTDADWNKMTKYLDATVDTTCAGCWSGTTIGGQLKSTTIWSSPNTGATNSSGFSALPGGYRGNNGTFYSVGFDGYWWTALAFSASSAWYRYLSYNLSDVTKQIKYKASGFSVRLVKD